jgi:leucine dehydrogenase
MKIKQLSAPDFEEIWHAQDPTCQFNAFIAIHSTKRGPAIGGVRFRPYDTEVDALEDAKRLAEGMTYKSAMANLKHGGGKGVMLRPSGAYDRGLLYERFAAFVNHLEGRYITATDAGTTAEDVGLMKQHSGWVVGAPQSAGGPGDPSPITAIGVVAGIRASVQEALGNSDLRGIRVAVQGLGAVGSEVVRLLSEAGCELWGGDTHPGKLFALAEEFGMHSLLPETVLSQECDVFCPCALGSIFNDESVSKLHTRIIAGSANDQLQDPLRHAKQLAARGILYAPDFVVNAGGLIHVASELTGYDAEKVLHDVRAIEATLLELFAHAREKNITPYEAAFEIAKARLG